MWVIGTDLGFAVEGCVVLRRSGGIVYITSAFYDGPIRPKDRALSFSLSPSVSRFIFRSSIVHVGIYCMYVCMYVCTSRM